MRLDPLQPPKPDYGDEGPSYDPPTKNWIATIVLMGVLNTIFWVFFYTPAPPKESKPEEVRCVSGVPACGPHNEYGEKKARYYATTDHDTWALVMRYNTGENKTFATYPSSAACLYEIKQRGVDITIFGTHLGTYDCWPLTAQAVADLLGGK